MPEVGCPDFATAAGRIESTRNCWPSSRSSFASIEAILGGSARALSPVGYGPDVKVAVAFDHRGVEHDDMNILCLGSEVVGPSLTRDLVRTFLGARFDGGERYVKRLQMIEDLERNASHA